MKHKEIPKETTQEGRTDMEKENMIPELTFGAAAEEITLTLGEAPATPAAPAPVEEEKQVERVKLDDSMLSEAEKKAVEEFARKIDIMDSTLVLQYGAAAQKNVAGFSENALASVRTKDLGEVGKSLSELVGELKEFGQEEEPKGLFGFFKKTGDRLETMRAQFSKV